jgi:hypothetical protein
MGWGQCFVVIFILLYLLNIFLIYFVLLCPSSQHLSLSPPLVLPLVVLPSSAFWNHHTIIVGYSAVQCGADARARKEKKIAGK